MIGVAPHARGLASASAPGLRRQRLLAGRPDAERRLHADRVGQAQGRDAGAERAVGTVGRIGQHDAARDAGRERGLDLGERDLGFGLELHRVGNMNLAPSRRVVGPFLGQIQTIGDRQARRMIGDRERHRDLAIVRLAQPPAILPRHAHRMRALLDEARVVDDPSLDATLGLDRRRDELAHFGQHVLVRPCRLTDEMQERLMFRRRARGGHRRSHRLHALPLERQQQSRAIVLQRSSPVYVIENLR